MLQMLCVLSQLHWFQALKPTAPVGISSLMERDKRRDSTLSSPSWFVFFFFF